MTSKLLQRVERVERLARDEHRRWLNTRTIDELEAYQRTLPPPDVAIDAMLEALTTAELEWLTAINTSEANLVRVLRLLQRRHSQP